MSTDVCADSGTVASFPILSISGLELFIGQVPCQGLNLIYIGTAFAGQVLPLGGNSIAASIIGTTLGTTLGLEGFENGACTVAVSSANPYASAGAVQGYNPGPEELLSKVVDGASGGDLILPDSVDEFHIFNDLSQAAVAL